MIQLVMNRLLSTYWLNLLTFLQRRGINIERKKTHQRYIHTVIYREGQMTRKEKMQPKRLPFDIEREKGKTSHPKMRYCPF